MKIITHSAPGHMDDFLALVLAGETRIKRVLHADVETVLADKTEFELLVDIGRKLDIENGLLDHHQDRNLPAAFVHMGTYRGMDILNYKGLWQFFSDQDTKGPVKAKKLNNINDNDADTIRAIVQPMLKAWDIYHPKGDGECTLFVFLNRVLVNRNYILDMETLRALADMTKAVIPEAYKEAEQNIAEEARLKEQAIAEGMLVHLGEYKVFINYMPNVHIDLADVGADALLVVNVRSDKPSIIVDTEKLKVQDILALIDNPPTDFIHATGFLAVLDISWEEAVTRITEGVTRCLLNR